MEIYFILVEPSVPENIGASARAIKTMGFNSLRLVKPGNFPSEKANWLAHGSLDILEKTQIYPNLKEAVHDLDFVIGTSAKKRSVKFDYYPASDLKSILLRKKKHIRNLGLVFGKEESGLTNQELSICDLVSYVPMAKQYPSLNLSQAVMLYAYHASELQAQKKIQKNSTSYISHRELKAKAEFILENIEISKDSAKFNRIMERFSLLDDTDLNLLHSISNKLILKLKL